MLMAGMNVIRRRATIMAMNRGRSGFRTLEILVPAIAHPTKRTVPTGGVHKPMQRLKTRMIPKWIGSMPNCTATGRKIGVKIKTAGVISMNMPTIRRKMLINKRMTIGLLDSAISPALMF